MKENLTGISSKPNVEPDGQGTVAFMQIVPKSFKPAPCNCNAEMGDKHKLGCSLFYTTNDDHYVWPPVQIPQVSGEQCGRCWQNHTPGFVCACECHETDEERDIRLDTTLPPQIDCGNDLDAPQNT